MSSWDSAGQLRFFSGPMGSGKSALACQIAFNRRAAGRVGLVLTINDRAGAGVLSSRIGLTIEAVEIDAMSDVAALVSDSVPPGGFVIVDEAQFLTPVQVEQLAFVADTASVDVDCFGIVTDFTASLFPGSRRLIELADEVVALQVEVLCWCRRPGRHHARIVDGAMVRDGDQVAVGDTVSPSSVFYAVLCRQHWRAGQFAP